MNDHRALDAAPEPVRLWIEGVRRANTILKHRRPCDSRYGEVCQLRFGDRLTAITVPGLAIDISGIPLAT